MRLVHVNTLLLQRVLKAPAWRDLLGEEDRRGLSPLFWTHVNLYGRFGLDMDTHLDLADAAHPRPGRGGRRQGRAKWRASSSRISARANATCLCSTPA